MVGFRALCAFTLIELLLVLVILSVLAAVVVPRLAGNRDKAMHDATLAEMATLKTTLNMFQLDTGRFPLTSEGLQALIEAPPELQESWHGPYIERVPSDKWGTPYRYLFPGQDDPRSFDLSSAGPDRMDGTPDDISSVRMREFGHMNSGPARSSPTPGIHVPSPLPPS